MRARKQVHDLTETFLAQLVDLLDNITEAFPYPFPF